MSNEIDQWLAQLAGQPGDDPLAGPLRQAVLEAEGSEPVDQLGLQRLLRRMDEEGLLKPTPTPVTRRQTPSWMRPMAFAATLVLGVSVGWQMIGPLSPPTGVSPTSSSEQVPQAKPAATPMVAEESQEELGQADSSRFADADKAAADVAKQQARRRDEAQELRQSRDQAQQASALRREAVGEQLAEQRAPSAAALPAESNASARSNQAQASGFSAPQRGAPAAIAEADSLGDLQSDSSAAAPASTLLRLRGSGQASELQRLRIQLNALDGVVVRGRPLTDPPGLSVAWRDPVARKQMLAALKPKLLGAVPKLPATGRAELRFDSGQSE